MNDQPTNPAIQVTHESSRSGRAQLSLRPIQGNAEGQRDAAVEAYLADQKAQQALSRGGRDYLDIDNAYDLGVGVTFKTIDPHNPTITKVREVDPAYKANLDSMLARGVISQNGYQMALRQALGDDLDAAPAADAGLAPLEYDETTSKHAHWTISQVGETAFRSALTSYVMGDKTAAVTLASQLHEHGVTVNDVTGLYDSMAQTALGKIAAVMEANGDLDVDVREVVDWARGLEKSQSLDLARSAMAAALYDNFDLIPEVVQAYRIANRKPR